MQQGSERWRAVVGYNGLYEVSNMGRLRGTIRQGSDGRVLSIKPDQRGYMRIRLYRDGTGSAKKIHRLVLEAFVGPCPRGLECCHNNGDASDNRLSNLRWGTRSDNAADAKNHGTGPQGERNGQAKLTRSRVAVIRQLRAQGKTYQAIADRFGINHETVRDAAMGKTWST